MKYFGPKSFGSLYDDLTQATFKKYGFINSKLINEWPSIVGKQLSSICKPDRISFEPGQTRAGTLYVILNNPAFSLELQSHESRIIDKISIFFGYKAVSKMRITLKPQTISEITNAKNGLNTDQPAHNPNLPLPAKLIDVKDDELKNALASLYQSLNNDHKS